MATGGVGYLGAEGRRVAGRRTAQRHEVLHVRQVEVGDILHSSITRSKARGIHPAVEENIQVRAQRVVLRVLEAVPHAALGQVVADPLCKVTLSVHSQEREKDKRM